MTTRKGGKHLRSLHPSDKLQRDDQAEADCVTMEEVVMEDGNDTKLHFEAERSARHAERPGFRITELQISSSQKVPWHYHTNVQDTFFVLHGRLSVFLQKPKEEIRLAPGETYTVRPHRPHLVTNIGTGSAVFLVLQLWSTGEYDFVLLT
jgi:quercetin dioxygenase-like cupin family protein